MAFYLNAIREWFSIHNFESHIEVEVRAEFIWNNILICSPRHTLSREDWPGWAEAGVTLVHHLCHPVEDRLLGKVELMNKYNIRCNFLQALILRQSLPHQWRNLITSSFTQEINEKFRIEIKWN